METYPILESNSHRNSDNLNEIEIPTEHFLLKKLYVPQNSYEVKDSKKRRVRFRALSPVVAGKKLMRSPSPPLPEPMDVEESDAKLSPHQECVKDFRVYLIYKIRSPLLLSSIIDSGCLSSIEKEELHCKPGVRCKMRKLLDILLYRKDRMLFNVFMDALRKMGFSSVHDAMHKRVHDMI